MVNADGRSMLMVAMFRSKPWIAGMSVASMPKRSPMVSTENPLSGQNVRNR
jgi:hypothetical protein